MNNVEECSEDSENSSEEFSKVNSFGLSVDIRDYCRTDAYYGKTYILYAYLVYRKAIK